MAKREFYYQRRAARWYPIARTVSMILIIKSHAATVPYPERANFWRHKDLRRIYNLYLLRQSHQSLALPTSKICPGNGDKFLSSNNL